MSVYFTKGPVSSINIPKPVVKKELKISIALVNFDEELDIVFWKQLRRDNFFASYICSMLDLLNEADETIDAASTRVSALAAIPEACQNALIARLFYRLCRTTAGGDGILNLVLILERQLVVSSSCR